MLSSPILWLPERNSNCRLMFCFSVLLFCYCANPLYHFHEQKEKTRREWSSNRLQGISKGSVSYQWAKHVCTCVRVCARSFLPQITDPVCTDGRRTTAFVINVMVWNCFCAQRLHEYSPYELCRDALMAQPQSFGWETMATARPCVGGSPMLREGGGTGRREGGRCLGRHVGATRPKFNKCVESSTSCSGGALSLSVIHSFVLLRCVAAEAVVLQFKFRWKT